MLLLFYTKGTTDPCSASCNSKICTAKHLQQLPTVAQMHTDHQTVISAHGLTCARDSTPQSQTIDEIRMAQSTLQERQLQLHYLQHC